MEPLSSGETPRSRGWQRRRRRAQQEIVDKAMKLFSIQGYEATTVDSISEASLISSRTFYRYFTSKEDLVFHGFPDSVELLRREAESGSDPLFDRLRKASVTLAGVLEIDRQAWIRRFQMILSVPSLRARDVILNERYEDVFRGAMLEEWGGGEESDRRSRLLAGAIMGGIQTAIKMWVESGGQPSLPTLASTVFDGLESIGLRSLATPALAVVKVASRLTPPVTGPSPPPAAKPRRLPKAELDFFD